MEQIRNEIISIIRNPNIYNEDRVEELVNLIKKDRKEQLRIGDVGSITELELKNILIDFGDIVKKSLNKEVVDIAESFVVYNRIKD